MGRTKEMYEAMYLDWFNNYLTVDCFSQNYQISILEAEEIIKKGREISHSNRRKKIEKQK